MSPKTALQFLGAAAVAVALHAQPTTIVRDTFADGDRTTDALPASVAWYTTIAARPVLTVQPNALTLVANNDDRQLWGYIPAITLRTGESLTLTVGFSFSRTPPTGTGPFKIALCSTNGLAPRRADIGAPTGAYRGYGSFTNPADATSGSRLRKRNGPAASSDSAVLLEITDGPNNIPIWDTFGAARTGLSGALQGNTPYTCTLKITRTSTDAVSVTTTLSGGALNAVNTLTEIDATNIFTTFDTLALGAASAVASGDLVVRSVELTYDVNSTRLGNISILTTIPAAGDSFTLGYVVAGAGPKPLVIRAAGPSLGALGLPGTLDDPKLELFSGSAKTGENDNWGGGTTVRDAMAAVGAFAYASPTSLDAAVAISLTSRDNNSVKISAAGNGTGTVIAEIYDATPDASFTPATPRIVNMSVLKHLGTGLTVGFYVAGSGSKSVLVRAIGPTLGTAFGLEGVVADPQLTLRSSTAVVSTNDNWSGTAALTTAFSQVSAFALPATSRDAALVATLPPGSYTVQVSGVGGGTGLALVEVYELP